MFENICINDKVSFFSSTIKTIISISNIIDNEIICYLTYDNDICQLVFNIKTGNLINGITVGPNLVIPCLNSKKELFLSRNPLPYIRPIIKQIASIINKFEYLVEGKSLSNLRESLQEYLNEKGKEGWELVYFKNNDSDSYVSESCKLIFKRQINER
jgi:hypothetical protein